MMGNKHIKKDEQYTNRATYSTIAEADISSGTADKTTEDEYNVTITETLQKTVVISARSQEEAEEIVEQKWNDSEYILDADSFVSASFEAEKIDEILWEPVRGSENDEGKYSIYATVYNGIRYWITETEGRYCIEVEFGDRTVLAHRDAEDLGSLDEAKDFFEDYIAVEETTDLECQTDETAEDDEEIMEL